MAASYDEAVAKLYQAPHDAFVAERKRLAAELKAAGDKPGAARLAKLARPPLSAWAVNQLWWRAGDSFERLFAAAVRLRAGDQGGAAERRDALAALKARAAALLVEGGHAVNEATLRRVTTTLAALAASGSFEPDPAGALTADREPPGFDAAGFGAVAGPSGDTAPRSGPPAGQHLVAPGATPAPRERPGSPAEDTRAEHEGRAREAPARSEREREREEREHQERAAREREEREREERERAERLLAERRLEAERAARRAERERLRASLPPLRSDLERREREVERLRAELARVQGLADQAAASILDAESRLAELGDDEP